jgi:hypothetical protein
MRMRTSIRRRTVGWLAVAATSLALFGVACEDNDTGFDDPGMPNDTAPAPIDPEPVEPDNGDGGI